MNELTDLEICKKIAEIAGYKTSITDNIKGIWASIYKNDCYNWFNPLTDDALCFQLMVENKVNVWFFVDEVEREIEHEGAVAEGAVALAEILGKNGKLKGYKYIDDIKDINRAVCLAIIEANKDK